MRIQRIITGHKDMGLPDHQGERPPHVNRLSLEKKGEIDIEGRDGQPCVLGGGGKSGEAWAKLFK